MERPRLDEPAWLTAILENPQVTDICINGSSSAYLDKGQGMECIPTDIVRPFLLEGLKEWILNQLSLVGKTWDAKHPFVDATLKSGHRLHVVFPPLSPQGILVSMRRLARARTTICQLQSQAETHSTRKWAPQSLYDLLARAVKNGDSILISGATGSGKTTLANDLLGEVPIQDRIIALEDTSELAPSHPQFLSLIGRPANSDGYGEVTLRDLLKQTLRMRPDRIVLGECRGSEVLELLQALNTGHRGAMATLHANSPRDALRRIELLCLLAASGSIPLIAIRELLSLGIQWIVQVKRFGTERKITEVWRVEGREGDTILMRQMLE